MKGLATLDKKSWKCRDLMIRLTPVGKLRSEKHEKSRVHTERACWGGQEVELWSRGSTVSFMRKLTRTIKPTMKPLTNKVVDYPPGGLFVANFKITGWLPTLGYFQTTNLPPHP